MESLNTLQSVEEGSLNISLETTASVQYIDRVGTPLARPRTTTN